MGADTAREELGRGYPLVGTLLRPIDRHLRRRQGIFEYSDASDCILRIQPTQASQLIDLSDGTRLRPGDKIINLHFWNEHIPSVPESGMTWAWAKEMHRLVTQSLRRLALYLATHAEFDPVQAVRANLALESANRADQMRHVLQRYGFEFISKEEKPTLAARLHRLGENILITFIVLANNPAALRSDSLQRDRAPAYLSRRVLEARYGR